MRFHAQAGTAAVASVPEASPACPPCKRSSTRTPCPLRTSVPSNVPKVTIAGSLPAAAPGVRASSRSCGFSSNSSLCRFPVSPAPTRGSPADIIPLFACCPCSPAARALRDVGLPRVVLDLCQDLQRHATLALCLQPHPIFRQTPALLWTLKLLQQFPHRRIACAWIRGANLIQAPQLLPAVRHR
jgi:hypothetical protein